MSDHKLPLKTPLPSELKAMAFNGHSCIVVRALDWTILLTTPIVEVNFGYARGELVGQPLEMLIPEKNREIHRQHVAQYIKNPTTRAMGFSEETRLIDVQARLKDGTVKPVTIALYPEFLEGQLYVTATILFRPEALTHQRPNGG